MLRDFFFRFNNVDIKDDMQMVLLSKLLKVTLNVSAGKYSSLDIDRPLTEEERRAVRFTVTMMLIPLRESLIFVRTI